MSENELVSGCSGASFVDVVVVAGATLAAAAPVPWLLLLLGTASVSASAVPPRPSGAIRPCGLATASCVVGAPRVLQAGSGLRVPPQRASVVQSSVLVVLVASRRTVWYTRTLTVLLLVKSRP